MRTLVAVLIGTMLCSPGAASEPTVEEAYKSIPHARTVFDGRASKLSPSQIASLTQLFGLAERGIVLKVATGRALQDGNQGDIKKQIDSYRQLIGAIESMPVSEEIGPARDLVLNAVRLHRRFFETKNGELRTTGKLDFALRQNADVLQASRSLQSAYGWLIKSFPGEPQINKQAFYDYLCALDFL